MRRNGLQVDGYLGNFTVSVTAAETLTFHPDLVLLTVKTQDVATAVQSNLASLTGVPLVTCQNGVRSDDVVASLLPRQTILSAVVFTNALYAIPGRVTVTYSGTLIVGRPFGPLDRQAHEVVQVLNRGIPTRLSHNIRGAHWLKLILSLNNALSATTNYDMGQVYSDPFLSRLGIHLMREGLRVTKHARIQLKSLPEVPLYLMRLLRWLPVGLTVRAVAVKARQLTSWPVLVSTLQSIRRGRPTEIDYLNGEIVQLGQRVGVPAPLNAAVVELVHRVERTGQFISVEEVRRALESRAERAQ
jgi:2-dehydropantoate 2-reductase